MIKLKNMEWQKGGDKMAFYYKDKGMWKRFMKEYKLMPLSNVLKEWDEVTDMFRSLKNKEVKNENVK